MTPEKIERLVQREIVSFKHTNPEAGSTIGMPWSEPKIMSYISRLKGSLVTPYLRRFVLVDTHEQMSLSPPVEADYWVVAEIDDYLEFYDPTIDEFGLAIIGEGGSPPQTIGVRGDLIGTFCAI